LEYGLWEYENGDITSSIKTFQAMVDSHGKVMEAADEDSKADLCALYKTFAEILVSS